MAATPYKGVVYFKGLQSGQDYYVPVAGDDVATNYMTWSKTGLTYWQAPELVELRDINLTAAGVDTKRIELFANGMDVGMSFNDASILSSIPLPRIPGAIPVAGGTQVQFKQQTS